MGVSTCAPRTAGGFLCEIPTAESAAAIHNDRRFPLHEQGDPGLIFAIHLF